MSVRPVVRLKDLAPGDTAVDTLGGIWRRAEKCVFDPDGNPVPMYEFQISEDFYGPFTRGANGTKGGPR